MTANSTRAALRNLALESSGLPRRSPVLGGTIAASELWLAAQRAMPNWARSRLNATVIMISQGAMGLRGGISGSAGAMAGTRFTLPGAAVLLLASPSGVRLSINFAGDLDQRISDYRSNAGELFHDCASFEQRVQCHRVTQPHRGRRTCLLRSLTIISCAEPTHAQFKASKHKAYSSRSDGIKENQKSENNNISQLNCPFCH